MTRLFPLLLVLKSLSLPGVACSQPSRATPTRANAAAEAILSRWFHLVERDRFDSLPPLLAADFQFQADGNSWNGSGFVSMIRGLGIHHPSIRLSDVKSTTTPKGAAVTYRRLESFELKGAKHQADEIGTVELIRKAGAWRIRRWRTTDVPPPAPVPGSLVHQ